MKHLLVLLHLTLNPYHRSSSFQLTYTHAPLYVHGEELVFKSSNQLLKRAALALQVLVAIDLNNQGSVTELT
jgi:hypothetical protein